MTDDTTLPAAQQVLLFGATGTIGMAVYQALIDAGHKVTCFVRDTGIDHAQQLPQATIQYGDVTSIASLRDAAFAHGSFDAVISCLGSRTGTPEDAWAIDHHANVNIINTAAQHGVRHCIFLSAICVQKPILAFQFAKLAAEQALKESGMTYSIVRPTAFFKSLSGQIERLRAGKAFLAFGNGELTACKPISDHDLAVFIVQCLSQTERYNQTLPIGGPGPAITPKAQAELLFQQLDRPVSIKKVPVALLDVIITLLKTLGIVFPKLRAKAELARIGRYYATESMLVWDDAEQRYRADLTPSTGTETLNDYYTAVIRSGQRVDLRDHGVF